MKKRLCHGFLFAWITIGCTSKVDNSDSNVCDTDKNAHPCVDNLDSTYRHDDSVVDSFLTDKDIFINCTSYPELDFPIEEGDTVINGVKFDWSVFESHDNADISVYHDSIFYYGTSARIIISDTKTDTVIISNYRLRNLMFDRVRLYRSDKETVNDPYFAKFNLVSLTSPKIIDDTVRFVLTNYWLDTDICWTFYCDFTAKGDSLYARPVYESDYEDEEY